MSFLDEVAAFLASEGLGTVGTDLFSTEMPATPNACGCVYESGGSAPDMPLGSSTPRFENPTVQVVFRGAPDDYTGPRVKAQSAFDAMIGISADQVLSGTKYLQVLALQQPFPLGGKDGNKRWKIVCNFLIQKEPS